MKIIYPLFFIPAFTYASVHNYDLKVSYALREEKPLSGRLLVKEGKTAVIKGKEHFLEVVAEEGKIMGRSGILLSFNVVEMVEGKRSVLSQPKLLVKESEEAKITIDDVALSVTATRSKK